MAALVVRRLPPLRARVSLSIEQLHESLKYSCYTAFTDELPRFINTQRRFLLRTEMMATKPITEQAWETVFEEWAARVATSYRILAAGEHGARVVLEGSLRASGEVKNAELAVRIRRALHLLSRPLQRLRDYRVII